VPGCTTRRLLDHDLAVTQATLIAALKEIISADSTALAVTLLTVPWDYEEIISVAY